MQKRRIADQKKYCIQKSRYMQESGDAQQRKSGRGNRDNGGFSLVEVLVCIAILAIICIPLSAGFRTSSLLNNRAHHTQMATSYAQETVEDMKRLSVKEFAEEIKHAVDGDGNPSGTVTENVDLALQAKFPGYEEELFKTITCKQESVEIGGKRYQLEAVYDPTPYSAFYAGGTESAADVNVFAVSDAANVDGMKYPVISNEISSYEGTGDAQAAYLNDLWWLLSDDQRASSSLNDLYNKTKKLVEVRIKDEGGSGIRVLCDVTYEVPEYSVKKTYNVYNGSFLLEEVTDAEGNFVEYAAGGKIYLFARAYQDQTGGMGGALIADNTIKIINEHTGNPLEVYLVRGYYSDATPAAPTPTSRGGVNFDHVYLGDGSLEKPYSVLAPGEVLTGEAAAGDPGGFPNMNFHTNIKGKNLTRVLTQEDMDQTIGKDVAKLRCYQLTVTLTDMESGKTAAHIVSAKEN